jgi:alpha-tubulin suppressor-like RCC1 family protein
MSDESQSNPKAPSQNSALDMSDADNQATQARAPAAASPITAAAAATKDQQSGFNRRGLLKFAGVTSLVAIAEKLFINHAHAQTWRRLTGTATGGSTHKRVRLPQRGMWKNSAVISGGSSHTVALRSDGLVFASGNNSFGQLGDNTAANKSTFVQAIGISNVVAVACGNAHTVAIRSDGLVFATGSSYRAQLGDNSGWYSHKSTFVQAIGISHAVAITAGENHTSALRSDGLVFACGYNSHGQLGDNTNGTTYGKATFVQAIGISNAVAIAAGRYHTVALRSDGFVFATGANGSGQLGDNTGGNKNTFVQAIGISHAIAVAACGYHTVALRSDGLIFACGYNHRGQLGDGTSSGKMAFVQAIGISNAVAIACGWFHTIALRSDGLVFACGDNINGELGDATNTYKLTFVQAIGISNAVAIAAGGYHTIALRSDGRVLATGSGSSGQLGDNTTGNKITFVQAIGP